ICISKADGSKVVPPGPSDPCKLHYYGVCRGLSFASNGQVQQNKRQDMRQEIEQAVQAAVNTIAGTNGTQVELTRPDEQFGDYATNAALQLAGTLHRKPREVAE